MAPKNYQDTYRNLHFFLLKVTWKLNWKTKTYYFFRGIFQFVIQWHLHFSLTAFVYLRSIGNILNKNFINYKPLPPSPILCSIPWDAYTTTRDNHTHIHVCGHNTHTCRENLVRNTHKCWQGVYGHSVHNWDNRNLELLSVLELDLGHH